MTLPTDLHPGDVIRKFGDPTPLVVETVDSASLQIRVHTMGAVGRPSFWVSMDEVCHHESNLPE